MIPRISLFGKHLLISILIIFLFVSALGFLSVLMIQQFHKEAPPMAPAAVTFAKFLHKIPKNNRQEALEKINDTSPNSHFQFWLLDEKKQVIFPASSPSLPIDEATITFPEKIFEYKNLSKPQITSPSYTVVQIDDGPPRFLLVRFIGRGTSSRNMLLINSISLLVAVILGTTLSLFILFYSLKKKARLADYVISELQSGNLKARFPITKMDGIGEAMLRFNKMADEIERLVERLKTIEKSRMSLLQELAHDLRTPVSSLKSMLETLSCQDGRPLPEDIKKELTTLSIREVDYFEHLVEDLLFLAQASEPKYNTVTETVDLADLIKSEIESSEKSTLPNGNKIAINQSFQFSEKEIKGDSHLLRRLFRNALDNAVFSAKKDVMVKLKINKENLVECLIEDDGNGFSEEAFREFGHRKVSRKFASQSLRRASIGLGSVIMQTVVQLHRGDLQVANLTDSKGKILGAQVRIVLPAS